MLLLLRCARLRVTRTRFVARVDHTAHVINRQNDGRLTQNHQIQGPISNAIYLAAPATFPPGIG